MMEIHGERVYGAVVDGQTRCTHHSSELDIIAIKFKCCGRWYPCFECHTEADDHKGRVWPAKEFSKLAVMCGSCGHKLAINEYLKCGFSCPACERKFNPGCDKHHQFYFER